MNDFEKFGDRLKKMYEDRTRFYLPRRTNLIIRIDGKAFHSYTKHCSRPFDDQLMNDMNSTAISLCEEIQGAKLAYVQSDEINIWATDYDKQDTNAWFDNNIQKITSVSASIATAKFNLLRINDQETGRFHNAYENLAYFDARTFTIPELYEIANFFKWRSDDASRNSVQMVARSLYSHKELEGKNNTQLQEMIFQKGENWNDLPSFYKRGRYIVKVKEPKEVTIKDKIITVERNIWKVFGLEDFTYNYWYGIIKELAPKNI